MVESNINLENTAFFDNVTWLNQANWQNYFGKTLPNGVIVDGCLKLASNGYTLTGTMDVTSDESNVIIGTGAVMANGLYAENNAVVQIPHVTSAESTKLILVQFDLAQARARIITKTSVLDSGANVADAITALNIDESYLCTRNAEIYEIPLAFDTYAYGTIDLRRLVYAPSGKKHYLSLENSESTNIEKVGVLRGKGYCQLYGGTAYKVSITSSDTAPGFYLYPIYSSSTEPIIVKVQNSSGSVKNIFARSLANQLRIEYDWTDSWETGAAGKYISLADNSSMILVLFPVEVTNNGVTYSILTKGSASGGDIDPDAYYTKLEINTMMNQKAPTSYVETELAKKEFTANLKALAYQDKVDYLTQVNNRPTLGTMAEEDDVSSASSANLNNLFARSCAPVGNSWAKIATKNCTLRVSSDGSNGAFTTISSALNSVTENLPNTVTRVEIKAGTYNESISIRSRQNVEFVAIADGNNNNVTIVSNGQQTINIERDGRLLVNGSFSIINKTKTCVNIEENGVFCWNDSISDNLELIVQIDDNSSASEIVSVNGGNFIIEKCWTSHIHLIREYTSGSGNPNPDSSIGFKITKCGSVVITNSSSAITNNSQIDWECITNRFYKEKGTTVIYDGYDANTYYVKIHEEHNASYKKLQDAINEIEFGQSGSINIPTGIYEEAIIIENKKISLKSTASGDNYTNITTPSGLNATMRIEQGADVNMSGNFRIAHGTNPIYITDGRLIISGKLLIDCFSTVTTSGSTGILNSNGVFQMQGDVIIQRYVNTSNSTGILVRDGGIASFNGNITYYYIHDRTKRINGGDIYINGDSVFGENMLDTPNDNLLYLRKHGQWVNFRSNEVGLGDLAFEDTVDYDTQVINKPADKLTRIYVSTIGNDETGDGTSTNPFRTIGKAVDYAVPNIVTRITVSIGSYSSFSVPRNKIIDIDTVNQSDTVIVNGNIGVSGILTLTSGSYTINGNIGVSDNGMFYGYTTGADDFIILQDGYFDIQAFGKAVIACNNITTTSSDYGVYCRSGGMFVHSNIKKGMVVNNAQTAFYAQSGIIIYARDITGTFHTKNAVSYGGIISTGNSNSHILS